MFTRDYQYNTLNSQVIVVMPVTNPFQHCYPVAILSFLDSTQLRRSGSFVSRAVNLSCNTLNNKNADQAWCDGKQSIVYAQEPITLLGSKKKIGDDAFIKPTHNRPDKNSQTTNNHGQLRMHLKNFA